MIKKIFKAWLIPFAVGAATVAGADYFTGLVGEAKASFAQFKMVHVSGTATSEQKQCLAACAEPMICPTLNTDFGLEGDAECALAKHFKGRESPHIQPYIRFLLKPNNTMLWYAHAVMPYIVSVSTHDAIDALMLDGGSGEEPSDGGS